PATVAMDQDVLVEEPDSTLRDDGVGAVPAGKPEVAMKTVGDEHGEPEMQATRRALDDRAPALGRAPAAAPKEPAAAFSRSQSVQMEMEEAAADGVGATRTVPREAPGSGFAALREETRLAEGGALAAARMRTEAVSENANEKADRELSFAAAARVQPLVKVREYLERGEWPPPNAVHAVALIDSFQYVYLQPADGTFRITVSMMPSPFHEDLTILSVGIQARKGNGVVLEKAGLGSTLPIVADNVNVRVEYTPDRVRRYHRFADETKKTFRAGSIVDPLHVGPWAAGHALTLLYELELTEGYVSAGNDQNLGVVHVEYQDPTDKKTIEIAEYFGKNGVSKDGFKESPGLVLAACVGEFAMIVNRGEDAYKGELAEVQRQLQTLGKAISQNSDLQELMQLVNQARRVAVGREEE
ncbi:MAG: von Willebrand factor type A domain-containing protein, partial [Candidatus Pacebacteria bacterium]|nr:von Willebrand factor type A domain-containing protein [Candidatus Paceibacterota bacterium]